MKLVEILAKELGEWPDGYRAIVQTSKALTLPVDARKVEWVWRQWDYVDVSMDIYNAQFECSELADDHATAIVTREMWQAERNKQSCERVEDVAAKHLACIAKDSCNVILMRDRIREIDATIEAMTAERAELVSKLADEGFSLIVQTAEPVDDMSDWRNWIVGDLLSVVSNSVSHGFDIGETVVYSSALNDDGDCGGCEKLDGTDFWVMINTDLKFHSRPSA